MTCIVKSCPIQPEIDAIIHLSSNLDTAISQLRNNLIPCQTCPADQCPVLNVLSHTLQIALIQLADELNLTKVVP